MEKEKRRNKQVLRGIKMVVTATNAYVAGTCGAVADAPLKRALPQADH